MIKEGDKLPAFKLKNQEGKDIELQDYKGKNLVIYIYPKDDTPGCTIEAIDFSTLKPEFEKKNTVILGLSKDSIKKHQSFCEKHKLTIHLLSDPDVNYINALGAWQEKSMYGKTYMGIIRSTYLVNAEGVISKIWNKVKVKNHAKQVLDAID